MKNYSALDMIENFAALFKASSLRFLHRTPSSIYFGNNANMTCSCPLPYEAWEDTHLRSESSHTHTEIQQTLVVCI